MYRLWSTVHYNFEDWVFLDWNVQLPTRKLKFFFYLTIMVRSYYLWYRLHRESNITLDYRRNYVNLKVLLHFIPSNLPTRYLSIGIHFIAHNKELQDVVLTYFFSVSTVWFTKCSSVSSFYLFCCLSLPHYSFNRIRQTLLLYCVLAKIQTETAPGKSHEVWMREIASVWVSNMFKEIYSKRISHQTWLPRSQCALWCWQ